MKNFELIYALSNILLLPAWLLLIMAPEWRWTERLVQRVWIPALYSAAVCLILFMRPASPTGASIATLQGFMLLLSSPYTALMIWIQLVIWDLFIGAWASRNARRHGIHRAWMVAPLIGMYLLGPPGLLLYFILRYALRRDTTLSEPASGVALN